MVQSGTYTVTATAEGYEPMTVYNVTANLDTFVVVNFALDPPPRGSISGYVYDSEMNPLAADVTLTDIGGYSAVSDAGTGYYEINYIPVGSHDVRASKPGYTSSVREDVQVLEGATASESFTLASPLFYDDFEAGLSRWTGGWALTTSQSHSSSHSMTDSPSGNYANNAYTTITLSSPVNLTGATSGALSFWHRYDTESGYDLCIVQVTTNGSTWTQVASYSGSLTTWTEVSIDITPYVGTSQFKVRFILDADSWINRDGWYVDDVQISRDSPTTGVSDPASLPARIALSNHPNPFGLETGIQYRLPATAPVNLAIYDVAGRLVRTLLDGEFEAAGAHEVAWNGRDDRGLPVATGVYFARIVAAGAQETRKLVFIR